MIDAVDARLVKWAQGIAGKGVAVSLSPPGDEMSESGVSIYLFDLLSRPPAGNGRVVPHQLLLRYLVSASADDPTGAHVILGHLVFSALETAEFEVEVEPLPLAVWETFNIRPRPAFVLRLQILKPRTQRVVPAVTQPLEVRQAPAAEVHGRVFGPANIPIAAARIEFPTLARHATTDADGWFRFGTIPSDPLPKTLVVSARGRSETRHWEDGIPLGEPLEIHLKLEG